LFFREFEVHCLKVRVELILQGSLPMFATDLASHFCKDTMTDSPEPTPISNPAISGSWRVAGLMSGTSLDGIDVAICRFTLQPGEPVAWALEHFAMTPFAPALRAQLVDLSAESAPAVMWLETARAFALATAEAVKGVGGELDLVCSSGQTIHHRPTRGWTAQLDSPAHLHAALGGIPVVADLRALDVALGGQGAPLVPLADRDLFPGFEACLNLGGFSNISAEVNGGRAARDIGPCNMLLNALTERHFGEHFDRDGALAGAGTINDAAVQQLLQAFAGGKSSLSLSREWFEAQIAPILTSSSFAAMSPLDQLATATAAVARWTAAATGHRRTLVTGGGARNATLLGQMRAHNPNLVLPEDDRLVDAKEAVAWAYLGLRRALGLPNTLPAVTGAREDLPGGALWGRFAG
jgi:anhydro-N-acetylmuramic acid kinase